jgi:hypothetical protein
MALKTPQYNVSLFFSRSVLITTFVFTSGFSFITVEDDNYKSLTITDTESSEKKIETEKILLTITPSEFFFGQNFLQKKMKNSFFQNLFFYINILNMFFFYFCKKYIHKNKFLSKISSLLLKILSYRFIISYLFQFIYSGRNINISILLKSIIKTFFSILFIITDPKYLSIITLMLFSLLYMICSLYHFYKKTDLNNSYISSLLLSIFYSFIGSSFLYYIIKYKKTEHQSYFYKKYKQIQKFINDNIIIFFLLSLIITAN